jgi:hypothetical protein
MNTLERLTRGAKTERSRLIYSLNTYNNLAIKYVINKIDMGIALPLLLIILGLVGVIVAIGMGIASVIKKSIHSVHTR